MTFLRNNTTSLFLVIGLLFTGTIAYAQEDPSGTGEQLLEVTVHWDEDSVELAGDGSGNIFNRFSSDGLVERSKPETVYLTITETTSIIGVNVCTFSPDAGLRFAVSYPSCATGNQDTAQLINGTPVFEREKQYRVAFTDGNGNVINSQAGDGSYLLPAIPELGLPEDLLVVTPTILSHPDGGKYYSIAVNITQTLPNEELEFFIRDKNVEVIESLGTFPIITGTITLPTEVPANSLPEGSYEFTAKYKGTEYLSSLPGITAEADGGSTESGEEPSTGGYFSTVQQDIIANGIVPDCGYDIKTLTNTKGTGRMCGLVDAIALIQRLIEYVFVLILPIAAIIFVFVGYLFLTSGGNPDKRSKAKKAMLSLVIGIVIIMAAWLIVKTILVSLGVDTGIANQFLDLST